MSDLSTSILDLRGEAVCEMLDLGQVHLQWTARHLVEGRHEQALAAFDKFLMAARAAAAEMKAIKVTLADKELAVEAAVDFRCGRDGSFQKTGS